MSTKSVGTKRQPPRVLTIGGSDSGGSAGIQADLKTFEARGVFGSTALTVVTAQDTEGVKAAHPLPEAFIRLQAETVLQDMGTDALKTGLLGRETVIHLVADLIQQHQLKNVVVDPVLMDGRGKPFVSAEAILAYQTRLFPLTTVIIPNLDEAALLINLDINNHDKMRLAAYSLHEMGAQNIIIKGGHLQDDEVILDLFYDGKNFLELTAPRLPVENPHGVGCTFASAVAAELAKGLPPSEAAQAAHGYLQTALAGSLKWHLGKGRLPVYHAVKIT